MNGDRRAADRADSAGRTPVVEATEWEAGEDFAALQVYDAVQLVTSAIGQAGLSRVAIAHAIRDLSPIEGVSGRIEWDAPGSNTRPPTLATLVQGRITPLPAPASFSP